MADEPEITPEPAPQPPATAEALFEPEDFFLDPAGGNGVIHLTDLPAVVQPFL